MKITPLHFFFGSAGFLLSLICFKTNAQTDTLWQKVWHLYQNENFDSALVHAEKLRELALKNGSDLHLTKALSIVAKVYRKQGNTEASVLVLYDLLETGKKLNNPRAEGSAYLDLGRIFYDAYDYNVAVGYLKKANERYEQANIPNNQAIALYHIARSFLKKSQPDSALYFLNQALIVNPPKYKALTSSIFNLLGWVGYEKKHYTTARDHYRRSLQYAGSDRKKHAVAYHNIGETYLLEGNPDAAKKWLDKAMEIKTSLKNPALMLSTVSLLAKLHEQQGDITTALSLLQEGLEAVDKNKVSEATMNALGQISSLISRFPQASLPLGKLKGYLTTYDRQYQALKNQKVTLQESSSRQQLQAIAREYQLKKAAGLEKEKAIRNITGLVIAGIFMLTLLLIRQKKLSRHYKNEKKMVAYATERLQESLLINDSLKRSYKDIHRKFNEDDKL